MIGTDFYPTLLAAGSAALPKEYPGDGVDLKPVLKQEPKAADAAPRTLYWHYPHYGNQGGAPATAVRRVTGS
ncbi:hypothetical protein [Verrucomicrobium spinosum]|uniref:hypothetical protein n=1 Tax=Verrucomicrobium spinosum TaxID=2736 RepID=UPI001C472F3A|nr:hypothetical protein [Verrucomicrobium spinosum]